MPEAPLKTPSAGTPHPGDNVTERRTFRDYLIILRERLWIALPLALIVALGYGYYKAREKPLYMSQATMQIEKPERVIISQEVVDQTINSDADLNTFRLILRSNKLRTKVIESFTPDEIRIIQRPYLAELKPGMPAPPVGAILGNFNEQPVPRSFMIIVTVTHRDPEAAALIVNRYVHQFMQYLLDSVGGKNEDAVEYLRARGDQLRKEAEAADQKLQDYMRQHHLVSLDGSVNIVSDRLKSVNAALQTSRLERINIEEMVRQVDAFQKESRNLLEIGYIANHGTILAIRNQLSELTRQQSVLSERYFERHPKMIETANSIAAAQGQLGRAIDLAIADLRASLEKARANEKNLEGEYAANEKEQMRLRDLAVDFKSLENQASVAKSNYAQILDRLSQTTTTRGVEKIPVHVLDRGTVPGAHFSPRIGDIVRTSIGLGLLVFLGVAIGLSFLDDRIKSSWDVESFIGVPLLGIVPDLGHLKDDGKYSLVLKNTEAPGVESFLSVYSSIKIHSKLDFPKSILVTSTIPGEGKTLVSCNVAASFARHGRKTLLVDCDLRRPMLHRHYNQPNEAGIIAWYDKGASLENSTTNAVALGITKIGENLFLLCSGGRSKSPTQLLESPAFTQLIDQLKKRFDLVVMDSPPMGAVTDSLLIAERADEIIYVCRFGKALRKHIRLYIRALHNGKNEILGIVLNGLSTRRIEYYSNYRYYRSYKKYYGTQT
ncbi:MAG: polysaccharide biosynthesis tyrosine autokinase [Verrucomicrobia bacterium]|nr:polysaccharide biosynthesis tyrosine autokinase [Verrucomicrobiota bacterium]